MQLYTFGLNHHTAPVAIREQVAFDKESVAAALTELQQAHGLHEAAILSTCNRTEIYCHTDQPDQVVDWLAGYHRLPRLTVQPYLYRHHDRDAVRHAFRVAAGLDSMVLGETQILGQMKQAVDQARQAGTLGTLLNKLFQNTFSVAKEIRSSTSISANSVSMAAAAVKLAGRIYADLGERQVLFLGAGEMIESCVNHFAAQKPRRITIANRTLQRAEKLAAAVGGDALALIDVPTHLHEYDVVVASTGSPLPIIGLGLMERAVKLRRHKPIIMVDLAVPRDIEPEVGKLDDVYLYGVDDLARIVEAGLDARQGAATQAEAIIDARAREFEQWVQNRRSVPIIRALHQQAENYRRQELERATRRLAAGEDPQQVLEQMSAALARKFLHIPSHALNHCSAEERADLERWLKRLYSIHNL